jgi:hypothetical protein
MVVARLEERLQTGTPEGDKKVTPGHGVLCPAGRLCCALRDLTEEILEYTMKPLSLANMDYMK